MSALARARLGYAAGCALGAAGVVVNWGPGWGLLVGGVTVAASFLVLADTDGKGGGERR